MRKIQAIKYAGRQQGLERISDFKRFRADKLVSRLNCFAATNNVELKNYFNLLLRPFPATS